MTISNSIASLVPHGYCLSWRPDLMALHIISDAAVALSYYTIPVMLLVLVRKRKDLQFSWVFVLFGAFILACGATHAMSLWTLWYPDYLAAGIVKAVTAAVSVATAVVLVKLIPKALALPGPAQWRAVNEDLHRQVEERRVAEAEVRRLNAELELRVQMRTAELLGANERLSALHAELEQRVQDRTAELRQTQAELVSSAHRAGMAEIATNVLHNVGNVLNSINVSAGLLAQSLRQSKLSGLSRAAQMLQDRSADLGRFMTQDEKGRRLPNYLARLSLALAEEQRGVLKEVEQLSKSVDHIREIVATQQTYAGGSSMVRNTTVTQLLDDALRMNAASLSRHEITVERDVADLPELALDRHRVLQILVNLIINAKQAMDAPAAKGQRLLLQARLATPQRLCISVVDEGEGITAQNLERIFSHGFTTRLDGHGFGLHSCIVAAREMGGDLTARSDGAGCGAVFALELPVAPVLEMQA